MTVSRSPSAPKTASPSGEKPGHRQAGRDPQHLRRGPCLGQRPPRVQQERLARAPPVAGDRRTRGGARRRFGDLLEGADQLVRPGARVDRRLGAAADGTDHMALLVHDPQPRLGERALGDGELDDPVDLVPVDGVETGAHAASVSTAGSAGRPRSRAASASRVTFPAASSHRHRPVARVARTSPTEGRGSPMRIAPLYEEVNEGLPPRQVRRGWSAGGRRWPELLRTVILGRPVRLQCFT